MSRMKGKMSSVLCIFCYRRNDILRRFVINVNRQFVTLRTKKESSGATHSNYVPRNVCFDCFSIIEKYCMLHQELKCLELRLNWQIEKLWNSMKSADCVPSRVMEWMNSVPPSPMKLQSQNANGIETFDGDSSASNQLAEIENHVNFRNTFEKQCSRFHSTCKVPYVSLSFNKTGKENCGSVDGEKETSHQSSSTITQIQDGPVITRIASVSSLQPFLSDSDGGGDGGILDVQEWDSKSDIPDVASVISEQSCNNEDKLENLEMPFVSIKEFMEEVGNSNYMVDPLSPANITEDTPSQSQPSEELQLCPTIIRSSTLSTPAIKSNNASSPSINISNAHGPPETHSKFRRSLRQVFQCGHCSSTNKLEDHITAAGHGATQMKGDESDDNAEERRDAMDNEWDNGACADTNGSTKMKKELKRKITEKKADMESDDTCSSDSEGDNEELKSVKKKPRLRKQNNQSNQGLYECVKCTPKITFQLETQLQLHTQYLHSNGRIRIESARVNNSYWYKQLKKEPSRPVPEHYCSSDNCSKSFFFKEERKHHEIVYHGVTEKNDEEEGANIWTCQFCDKTHPSIIDLIDHELEHSDDKQQEEDKDFQPGTKYICGRCSTLKSSKMSFINHYLEDHLEMLPIQATCPICKETFKHRDKVPLNHFTNYHDVRRLEDPEKPFRCSSSECSAYFLTEDQLHVHLNQIHKEVSTNVTRNVAKSKAQENRKIWKNNTKQRTERITCTKCPRTFEYEPDFLTHFWLQHNSKNGIGMIKKGQMGKVIISNPDQNLTVDDLLLNKKAKYFCKVESCKKGFMEEKDLDNHSKLHGEFKCNFCEVVKTFAPDLAIHEAVHKVGEKYENDGFDPAHSYCCGRCSFSKSKSHKSDFIEHHVEKHLGLKLDKLQCPICKHVYPGSRDDRSKNESDFAFKYSLVKHYVTFHDLSDLSEESKDDHKCGKEGCIAYFRSGLQLQEHIFDIHENISKKDRYKCEDCGQDCENTNKLIQHRKLKHALSQKDLKFVCNVPKCGKRYERQIDLETHNKNTHIRGKGQLECPKNCGKKFWTRSALTAHLKSKEHVAAPTDEKSHVCDECGKRFKRKQELQIHQLFHAGPEAWKFECEICKKKVLNEHMRVHTKEKPFVCQICGVAYAYRNKFVRHMRNKHNYN